MCVFFSLCSVLRAVVVEFKRERSFVNSGWQTAASWSYLTAFVPLKVLQTSRPVASRSVHLTGSQQSGPRLVFLCLDFKVVNTDMYGRVCQISKCVVTFISPVFCDLRKWYSDSTGRLQETQRGWRLLDVGPQELLPYSSTDSNSAMFVQALRE